jgi:lipopolysaccharide export system permease protein
VPLALVIAVGFTLNRLNTDSEIVVMNASGMSPWRIFSPFLTVGVIVSIIVLALSAYIAPKSLREMRTQMTKIRADLIANLMQPGRFTSVDRQLLTFHVRERRANGELVGLFIDDRRDSNERATFIAEQGQVLEDEAGTFLILVRGSAQRAGTAQQDPTIVLFDRYAFDLTPFTGSAALPNLGIAERYLWEIVWPRADDAMVNENPAVRWREMHDRLTGPLYPIVFAVLAFAVLGAPRTSRQSRGMSIAMAISIVAAVRLAGFACIVFSFRTPAAVIPLYLMLLSVTAFGLWIISRGAIVEPPAFVLGLAEMVNKRLARRTAPSAAPGAPA